jgi:hypothetical protein
VNVSVRGRCLPQADIAENDFIQYGGRPMELASKTPYPETGEVQFYTLQFRDRTDVTLP